MEPRALEKAQSLHKYVTEQGAKVSTFELAISNEEGIELLDWLVEQNPENDLLEADVAEAKRTGDPWRVLGHFVLLGLSIVPKMALN